jgi:predicted anti-sigma-YlaC factor YlaD
MRPCDELLDRLDDALEGTLPPALASHVRECEACRRLIEAAGPLRGDAGVPRPVRAPRTLVERLKSMPRLAAACDDAMSLMSAALDGEIDEPARARLLTHIHACPRCLTAWEAFATLHEVGAHMRAPRRLRAMLAMPPSQRLAFRRRRPLFDLRLATAAAYLLAAATIVFVSNPATVARASSSTVEKAGVYARAAVENRISAWSREARETVVVAVDWVQERGSDAIARARGLLGLDTENRQTAKNVDKSEQGGKQQ